MIESLTTDNVTTVTINKPERLNALSGADLEELARAWKEFQADDDARVAIVRGAGERAFAAGADVKDAEGFSNDASNRRFWSAPGHGHGASLENQIPVWKPVIAAVDGYCLGSGLTLVLGADIRLCTRTAVFGMPEVSLGVNTVTGAALLQRVMNPSVAAELLFAADNIDADRAFQAGLVSRVYDSSQELHEGAAALAARIAANAPLAVRATKEIMVRARELPLSALLPAGEAMRSILTNSADFAEGAAAFRERRPPRYEGR
jgi:E-phenylitaconyl-CoA hydratase